MVGFRNDVAPDDFAMPTGRPGAILDTEKKQRAALTVLLEDDPDDRCTATENAKQKPRADLDDPDSIPMPSVWHTDRSGNVKPRPYAATLRARPSWNYLLVNGERLPTHRELLRLQGFPEWFDLLEDYQKRAMRLTGNTIPIPMIQECAKALLPYISDVVRPPRENNSSGFVEADGVQRV
jgi:DNA (cytosine-5)-methyltransferase 1